MGELEPKEENETTPESGVSAAEIRNHDLFKKIIGEKDGQLKQALSELESLKSRVEEQASKEELLKKEEAGKYEEIKSTLMAENESLKKRYERDITNLKLENALARAGADEYFSEWAKQKYTGGDIDEYIEVLKADEKHASRFNLSQVSEPTNPPPSGSVPASRGSSNWTQIKAALNGRDPVAAKEASKQIQDYYLREGRMPPG